MRAFATEAGLLDAAEGGDLVGDESGVDADHAVLELFGDTPDAADIAAVEIGGQAIDGVIRHAHHILFAGEAHDRRNRPEDLFVEHAHAGLHFGQHRGFEELLAGGMRPAADTQLRAFADGIVDQFADLGHGLVGDQRTDLAARGEAIADAQRGHLASEQLDEAVVYRVVHVQPVHAHAGLPGIAVLRL